MDNINKVPLIWKILIAIFGGLFGLAIAVSLQHIRILYIPRIVLILSIIIQFTLSLGVFLGVMLFFNSELLPQTIPNDDFSALTIAYVMSSIPQIIVATSLLLLDKQIEKVFKSRYGEDPRKRRYKSLSNMLQKDKTTKQVKKKLGNKASIKNKAQNDSTKIN